MADPMTPERLADVLARLRNHPYGEPVDPTDLADLLAEVERLTARVAELEPQRPARSPGRPRVLL